MDRPQAQARIRGSSSDQGRDQDCCAGPEGALARRWARVAAPAALLRTRSVCMGAFFGISEAPADTVSTGARCLLPLGTGRARPERDDNRDCLRPRHEISALVWAAWATADGGPD